MNNPWLEINLSDYEKHMSLPHIGQAQYLSGLFELMLNKTRPASVAIIGCSGGNGLEKINPSAVKRIVCVDINTTFLQAARERFESDFENCSFLYGDISDSSLNFEPVDFIYSPLVLEYTDFKKAVNNISKLTAPGGYFMTILQLPNENIPEVSPSPFKSLNTLSDIFTFVSPDELKMRTSESGFELINEKHTTLDSGKSFKELLFKKI